MAKQGAVLRRSAMGAFVFVRGRSKRPTLCESAAGSLCAVAWWLAVVGGLLVGVSLWPDWEWSRAAWSGDLLRDPMRWDGYQQSRWVMPVRWLGAVLVVAGVAGGLV